MSRPADEGGVNGVTGNRAPGAENRIAGDRRPGRPDRRELRPGPGAALRVPGAGRRHRHGQVGHHLPEDRRDALLHRPARLLHAPGRGAPRRPGHDRLRRRAARRCPIPARPTRSSGCSNWSAGSGRKHRGPQREPDSTLARHADVHLDVSVGRKPAAWTWSPPPRPRRRWPWATPWPWPATRSAGFSSEDFARFHPGGRLGRKLLQVASLMHAGDDLPRGAPVGQPDATRSGR